MLKICEECGTEFEGKSFSKYCSANCRDIRNKRVKNLKKSEKRRVAWEQMEHTKECEVCGSVFELTQQHRHQKYCSNQCRKKAERVFGNKKDIDLKYKDKIRYGGNKDVVLRRDNYCCQLCNNTTSLVVHHIDCSGQSENPNNDVDNLVTLCRRCHINLHKNILKNI
jgi:5-methylcytosine-specific restriction endonuclease McrA